MRCTIKILFIRRDNIGDLICTTPAIHAVRQQHPDAMVGVLVNSYNAAVVENNPDVDAVYIYEKAKHTPDKTKLTVWWDNLKIFRKIRRERYDVAVVGGSYSSTAAKYALFSGARTRIGYGEKPKPNLFYTLPFALPPGDKHEVEKVFDLVRPLKIGGEPGKLILVPDNEELKKCEFHKKDSGESSQSPLLAICISARIKANKWSAEKFMELIDEILALNIADVLLLWAPGSEVNPTFPGDDETADRIRRHFGGRIKSYPTPALKSLIAALAYADIVITLDTGSLHMAAALNKVTIALMTRGKALTWYPWKTDSIVLTAESSVEEIRVGDVLQAVRNCIKPCSSMSYQAQRAKEPAE